MNETTGDEQLDQLLDRLEDDVDAVATRDLAPLVRLGAPSLGLHVAGRRIERIRRKLQGFDTAYVKALDAGDEAQRSGFGSTASFLTAQLQVSPGEARARVNAAAACGVRFEFSEGSVPPKRPVLAAARVAGVVSPEHTSVIIDALDKLPFGTAVEDVAAAEERLVVEAGRFDPAGVARLGRRILDHIDPDGTLRDHGWKQRIRTASLTRHHDGTGSLRALLTPEALEIWQTVLDPLSRPQPTGPDGPDPRTPGQRMHDALHDAGTRLLDVGDLPASGGTPATVVIHVTKDQYDAQRREAVAASRDERTVEPSSGLVETEHGNLLPVPAAFALADQAAVCTEVTDAKDVPLQLGRASRIATPGQTIALAARDRGCTFPGCDRPAAWTQRHHVIPWHRGGLTDLDNLALLCGYHHRSFEPRGWACVMKDGRPHWIPPAWLDPERRPMRNHHHDQPSPRPTPRPAQSRAGPPDTS
jgi:hypothetical protein